MSTDCQFRFLPPQIEFGELSSDRLHRKERFPDDFFPGVSTIHKELIHSVRIITCTLVEFDRNTVILYFVEGYCISPL